MDTSIRTIPEVGTGAEEGDTGDEVVTGGWRSNVVPAIQVPVDTEQITILADGTVSAIQAGNIQPTQLGQITLARFQNPAGLRNVGTNLLAATDASGQPEVGTAQQDGFGSITQGFLESSNVNTAEELVSMILAQRAFEANARVIEAGDQMLQQATALSR